MITTIMMKWLVNVAQIGVKKISRKFELKNPKWKRPFRRQT
jgi:hypothetical protein